MANVNVDIQQNKLKMLWIFVLLLFTFTEGVPLDIGSTTTTTQIQSTTTTVTQSPSSSSSTTTTTTSLQTDNGQGGTVTTRSPLTNNSVDKNVLLSAGDRSVQDNKGGLVNQLTEETMEKKNNTETATSKGNAENKETTTSQAVENVVVTTARMPVENIDDKIQTETESPVIMPINVNNLPKEQISQKPGVVPDESPVTTIIKALKDTESENNLSVDDNSSGTYIRPYNLETDRKNNDDERIPTVSMTTRVPTQSTATTSSASVGDIWSSDWDDSKESEESEKKTDHEDDDWSILEDGKDDSLLPVGDPTDGENNIADKFGDFWDERAFNQGPYIKEGLVTLIPDNVERKMENEISMITYYSWILFFTFLLLTVFVFFRQRHIFSAYWSWNNGPRTRHSSGSEEGKSLMKNVYA